MSNEIEINIDEDVQGLANWIASDPEVNASKFIKVCNLISDSSLPVRYMIQSSGYIYFYPINEEVEHCMCIISDGYGEPEELLKEWSENFYDAPTMFISINFTNKLKELNLVNVESIKRSLKLNEIGI